jgi:hypothetical protein
VNGIRDLIYARDPAQWALPQLTAISYKRFPRAVSDWICTIG